MSEIETHTPGHGVEVAFEDEDANIGKILGIGLLSLALFVLSLVALDDMFALAKEEEIRKVDLSVPSEQLQTMRSNEAAILHSYKLLDSTKATYRIPIDRAMRLVAEDSFSEEAGVEPR